MIKNQKGIVLSIEEFTQNFHKLKLCNTKLMP